MVKVVKTASSEYTKTTHGFFRFVPMLKNAE